MQYIDDIVVLILIYATAYGLGTLVSKLWWWLRIIVLLILFKEYFNSFDFNAVNWKVVLVLIVPAFICIYPSMKKTLSLNFGLPNPFRWIYDEMRERQYLKKLKRKAKAGIEAGKGEEEEARKKPKPKPEPEPEPEPKPKPKPDTKRNPYKILGVNESDSLEHIEKAYKELAKLYHPNMVNHLGAEFQEMAHEKFIEIKWAWDEVKKKKKI